MRCPSCKAQIPDDVSVCPKCEAVVDPELLNMGAPDEADAPRRPAPKPKTGVQPAAKPKTGVQPAARPKTGVQPAAAKPRTGVQPAARPKTGVQPAARPKTGVQPAAGRPKTGLQSAARPAPADPDDPQDAVDGDWRSRPADDDALKKGLVRPSQRNAPVIQNIEPPRPVDANEVVADANAFIGSLGMPDKLAFFGLVGMVVSCLFPWAELREEGDVMGVMTYGFVTFLFSCAALAAVVWRLKGDRRRYGNPMTPWLVQLAGVALGVLWALISIKLSWNSATAKVGTLEIPLSRPAFGLFLAIFCGVVAGAGTMLGLRERR